MDGGTAANKIKLLLHCAKHTFATPCEKHTFANCARSTLLHCAVLTAGRKCQAAGVVTSKGEALLIPRPGVCAARKKSPGVPLRRSLRRRWCWHASRSSIEVSNTLPISLNNDVNSEASRRRQAVPAPATGAWRSNCPPTPAAWSQAAWSQASRDDERPSKCSRQPYCWY